MTFTEKLDSISDLIDITEIQLTVTNQVTLYYRGLMGEGDDLDDALYGLLAELNDQEGVF